MRSAGHSPPKSGVHSSYSAGLAFSLASVGCIGIVTLLTSVLSARLYGITVVGQTALVLAPVTMVAICSTVREQPAMVRELAKLHPRHPRITGLTLAVFLFSFTLTALATAVGLLACYLVFRGPLHQPELFLPAAVALGGYLLIINTCWNADSVFGAFRAGRELFMVRLHQAILYGVLATGFALLTRSVWGMVLAYLGSWLSALLHRLLLLRRVMVWRAPAAEIRRGLATLREIVTFGLKLTPGALAADLSEASGIWILGRLTTINAVGAYSRAWNLASRLSELNWRITEMLLPTLVQHRAAGDRAAFHRVLIDSLRYSAFGLLLPAAVGGGAAEAIMRVFGGGFAAGAPALRWLLFVPLLQTLVAIQGSAVMASDRPLLTALVQGIRLVVTVGGGIALTVAFGITGMAVAMTGGSLVGFLAYLVILRTRLGISMPSPRHYRQLVGLAAAYLSGFLLSHLLERELPGVLGLATALAGGTLAYLLCAIGICGTTGPDRRRLRALTRRVAHSRLLSAGRSAAIPRAAVRN